MAVPSLQFGCVFVWVRGCFVLSQLSQEHRLPSFCAPPPLLLASPGVTEALLAPKGDGGWYLGGGWGVWGGHVTPVYNRTDTP